MRQLPEDDVVYAVNRIAELTPKAEIALCDTTGRASPFMVKERFEKIISLPLTKEITWAFHGHDTYGQGVANALAAWTVGVNIFDAATAGLGGCPFAPGASGNTATEDLVYAFNVSSLVLIPRL